MMVKSKCLIKLKKQKKIIKKVRKLQEETSKIKNKYQEKIYNLENENNFLRKVINALQKKLISLFIGYALNSLYLKKMNLLEILNLKMIIILIQKSKLNMRAN